MIKEKIKHRCMILLIWLIVVFGISVFLNHASFDPNFSALDVVTGATKNSDKKNKNENTVWNYKKDELYLSKKQNVKEVKIKTNGITYHVLKHDLQNKKEILLLSNKQDNDYQKAVEHIEKYFEDQGYQVKIKETTETMMLSMVHAGKFDLFLMSEEEK